MTLYIIRGLPGSGKTTLAKRLTEYFYEADQFFEREGVYTFDPAKIGIAHLVCQRRVQAAMVKRHKVIAVSNTFTQQWEIEPYRKLAAAHGYIVVELTMHGTFKNTHRVPVEMVAAMAARWEA